MRARVEVEAKYLPVFVDLDTMPLSFSESECTGLRTLYKRFDADDAGLVERLEVESVAGSPATSHDVKTIEYFIRTETDEPVYPWTHFGLASGNVDNLAQRPMVGGTVEEVLASELRDARDELVSFVQESRDMSMLTRAYGQPATPTMFGKEMVVYAARPGRTLVRVGAASDDLTGKLVGAPNVYVAHVAVYPGVDWRTFSREFVGSFSFEHTAPTTQVSPYGDLAALFDTVRSVNSALVDLNRDVWSYVSKRYLGQEAIEGETGSPTMPHKINPIDFENSRSSLSKVNVDLRFPVDYVMTSRPQHDLSGLTVKRDIGVTLAHYPIGYERAQTDLGETVPNEQVMCDELGDVLAIIGEAIQTILRCEGGTQAYKRVKEFTRGHEVILDDLHDLFADLDVDEGIRKGPFTFTPATYAGLVDEFANDIEN